VAVLGDYQVVLRGRQHPACGVTVHGGTG